MNKVVCLISLLTVFFLLITGCAGIAYNVPIVMHIPIIKNFFPTYIDRIDIDTNITKYQVLKIDILITDPLNRPIDPMLLINFTGDWSTANRYVRNNEPIPLDRIDPGEITKYSIQFDYEGAADEIHEFTFDVFVENRSVDREYREIYIRKY